MIGRRLPLIAIGAALLVAAGLSLATFATRSEAVGPLAPNQMALDATSGGSVNASRSVNGTAAFNVGVHVTNVGGTPYKGYLWQIEYPTAGIDFVGTVVENTGATGLDTCNAANAGAGIVDPLNNETIGSGAGCQSFGAGAGTSFEGQITTLDLQCVGDGVWSVLLLDTDQDSLFGATLLDATGAVLDTGTTGMTITCTGTGSVPPTATPTLTPTATFTPLPATPTNTPCTGASCPTATSTLPPDFTRTATPSSATPATTPAPTEPSTGGTPPPPPPPGATSTRPAGGPGGVIAGPDTGSGGYLADDGSANLSTIAILVALAPVVIALGSRKRGSSK